MISSTEYVDHRQGKKRHHVLVDAHVLLLRGDEVLLGLRQNTGYCDGSYHLPAGHLEAGESVVTALVREAKEEIGIVIDEADAELAHIMHNNASGGGRISFFFRVWRWSGEIVNREPEKCADLRWFPLTALPDEMVDYAKLALTNYAAGRPLSLYGW